MQHRSDGIDVFRGLSIVLVVLSHVALRIPLDVGPEISPLAKWIGGVLTNNGYEAVIVFFVISGFLITSHSLSRWGQLSSINLRGFYARRMRRIGPCLILLVAVLCLLNDFGWPHYSITNPNQSLSGAVVAVFGLQINLYEANYGYLPASWDVLWSLSIEEAFYLGFPLACYFFAKTRGFTIALLLLSISLPAIRAHLSLEQNGIWTEKAYLLGISAISMGVIAAIEAAHRRGTRLGTALLRWLGCVGFLAILCFESPIWQIFGNGSVLILTTSIGILMVSFGREKSPNVLFSSFPLGWLRSFGRLSYEIYLTHMFAVWFIVEACIDFCRLSTSKILVYFLALLLSWVLGWLVAKCIAIASGIRLFERTARV